MTNYDWYSTLEIEKFLFVHVATYPYPVDMFTL